MMKKIVKGMMVLVLMFVLLFENGILVSADGDMTYEEGAQRIVITDEMRQRENDKLSAFRKMKNYENYIKLNVIHSMQNNDYYCGPATVQQVILYITGSHRTQDFYAGELGTTNAGTDMTRIPAVLNYYIDEDHYMYSEIGDQSSWLEKVRYSLHYDRPAVLDINTDGIAAFPYPSTGHFVNVSGYNGTTGEVMITDPNDPRGNVWYSISDLYEANNQHFRKAIIW